MNHLIGWLLRLSLGVFVVAFAGCVSLHGTHCASNCDPVGQKMQLIKDHFEVTTFLSKGITRDVLVPHGSIAHRHGPPVVILHEFPALSAEVLELAVRLSKNGFSVYVPVMLNKIDTDPSNSWVMATTFLKVRFGKDWKAGAASAEHPVIDWVADFCNERVHHEHPQQKMGVIGMCLSGVFPVALLGKVQWLYAPVVAHPSMPFHLLSGAADRDKATTGLTAATLKEAQSQADLHHIKILGIRFERDHFATKERFATLAADFPGHFENFTLPFTEYHDADQESPDAHSVLGGCYMAPTPSHPSPATYRAYLKVLRFLKVELK